MKSKFFISLIFSLFFVSNIAFGATQTVVLNVPEMYCQLCAYLVNKTLRDMEGVVTTKANINDRLVTITLEKEVPTETLIKAVETLHYTAKTVEQK